MSVMYMRDYGVLNDKESMGLLVVYVVATSTETEHDKHLITAQKLIRKQAKDCTVTKSHVQSDYSHRSLTTTGMSFWFVHKP